MKSPHFCAKGNPVEYNMACASAESRYIVKLLPSFVLSIIRCVVRGVDSLKAKFVRRDSNKGNKGSYLMSS